MKNVLVIGAGRFGSFATIKLHDLGHQVMVVDHDENRINRLLPYASDARIGDSTEETFMKTLGVASYDLCIVSIGDDFLSSLQTTFTLKELGAKKVVARQQTGKVSAPQRSGCRRLSRTGTGFLDSHTLQFR